MKKRCSGILMPVSSLPGGYGIGSMGQAARDFVDFLVLAGQSVWQILPGVLAGVMASLFSVLALALLLDLNHEQYITLLPKSVTTAISMDVSRELGGIATLTGAIVILTGIVGALAAETVCKVFRITNPIAKGIGIGTASHAVGTSKALEIGEVEGAMSGLSVAVAGIMTAVLCPLFSELIH